MYIFAKPLALIIRPIYELVKDYGLTLIIVTVLIRLITIPLTVMSQKSVAKTQLIQPEIQKIQKKYANDKNKQSIELQKLYQKHQINPLGGCLPLIVQMLVLFGFIRVVYDPLVYILQMSKDQVNAIMSAVGAPKGTYQVTLCGMKGVVEEIIALGKTPIDFDFFGINLTMMPKGNEKDILVWIFPALATIATYISGYITKLQTPQSEPSRTGEVPAPNMSDTMLKIMPIMTAVFTYMMPIGMSLYWFVSTAVQILQQTVINKAINKKVKAEIEGMKK